MIHKLLVHARHHVLGYVALFVALSGTSYAATRLPADSVGDKQLRPGAAAADVFKESGPWPTLGSGKTLVGNYSLGGGATGGNDYATDSISFVFRLKSAPTPHYVKFGESAPGDCPGTLSNPKAKAGHLCLYEAEPSGNVPTRGIGDPVSGDAAKANRYGAIVNVHGDGNSIYGVSGTWAVTSP